MSEWARLMREIVELEDKTLLSCLRNPEKRTDCEKCNGITVLNCPLQSPLSTADHAQLTENLVDSQSDLPPIPKRGEGGDCV